MDQREIPPVADRVQRRGRLGEVLAHCGRVSDLLVAARELEVREADGARVMGRLRETDGPLMECDRA